MQLTRLREAIRRKNLLPFRILPKGGGVMSESKRFEELFCSVHVWTFFQKGGGGLPDSKNFEELFSLCLEIFQEREGGLPCPKNVEELFCLSLEIFQEERGGLPDSKDDEVLFLLWVRHFPRKIEEDDQNTNTLRNFSSYKIKF